MNIVIVGQGAIGLLCYSQLWRAQQNVSVKPSSAPWCDVNNIQFSTATGLSFALPFRCAKPQQLAQADLVLVCTKAFHVANAVQTIASDLAKGTPIILAHNGMGVIDELPLTLQKKHPILALLTTHGAMKASNHHVIHTGLGQSQLGLLNEHAIPKQNITQVIDLALSNTLWQQNISQAQWQKLAVNCVINPLTTLYNMPNGDCLKTEYQPLIAALIDEFVAIAAAEHYHFEPQALYQTIINVAQATANNCSSMRADRLNNRPSELNYITGYLCKLAEKHQISATNHLNLFCKLQQILK